MLLPEIKNRNYNILDYYICHEMETRIQSLAQAKDFSSSLCVQPDQL
jgi:hypothetical protein